MAYQRARARARAHDTTPSHVLIIVCDEVMESIEGELFRFCEEDKNLLAFVSTCGSSFEGSRRVCRHALIFVPGLTDGFMSLNYTTYLSRQLQQLDFSLVQVNLSSSFNQFGFSSLQQDCKEIGKLVAALKSRYGFKYLLFMGHSTGAQDVLFFLRYGDSDLTKQVNAVILQGAVSDRDIMKTFDQTPQMKKEAQLLAEQKRKECFLSDRLYDAPVTAERFLSLSGRLTPDDMFSVDLTEEELGPIFTAVNVPILMYFSESDEYIPDADRQRALSDKIVAVLKKQGVQVECVHLPGDHGLSTKQFYQPFIDQVLEFIQANFTL